MLNRATSRDIEALVQSIVQSRLLTFLQFNLKSADITGVNESSCGETL